MSYHIINYFFPFALFADLAEPLYLRKKKFDLNNTINSDKIKKLKLAFSSLTEKINEVFKD